MAAMLMGAVGGISSSPKQAHDKHHKHLAVAPSPSPSPLFQGKTNSSLEKEENQRGLRINVQTILTGVLGRGKTTPEMEVLRPPDGIGGRRPSG